jgi:hypothetical protein
MAWRVGVEKRKVRNGLEGRYREEKSSKWLGGYVKKEITFEMVWRVDVRR